MQRETWTPVNPDGSLDPDELRRPAETAEPTTWEVAIPPVGQPRIDALVYGLKSATRHERHRFTLTFQPYDSLLPETADLPGNVAIAVGPIRTQAEADEALPALLAVKAARREAVFAPRERVDLTRTGALGCSCEDEERCSGTCAFYRRAIDKTKRVDAVRVRGGEEPLHPAHVRALRDQAVTAGVPFSLSWGAWSWLTEPDALGKGGARVRLVGGAGCTLDGVDYPEAG